MLAGSCTLRLSWYSCIVHQESLWYSHLFTFSGPHTETSLYCGVCQDATLFMCGTKTYLTLVWSEIACSIEDHSTGSTNRATRISLSIYETPGIETPDRTCALIAILACLLIWFITKKIFSLMSNVGKAFKMHYNIMSTDWGKTGDFAPRSAIPPWDDGQALYFIHGNSYSLCLKQR